MKMSGLVFYFFFFLVVEVLHGTRYVSWQVLSILKSTGEGTNIPESTPE